MKMIVNGKMSLIVVIVSWTWNDVTLKTLRKSKIFIISDRVRSDAASLRVEKSAISV